MRSEDSERHLKKHPHLSSTAGFGTLIQQVAGLHRAVPSATLDKVLFNSNTL